MLWAVLVWAAPRSRTLLCGGATGGASKLLLKRERTLSLGSAGADVLARSAVGLPMAFLSTMALSRSLSTQVMRARCFTGDTWVDDDVEVWILAEVVRQDNTLLTVRRKSNGEDIEVDLVRPSFLQVIASCMHVHCRQLSLSV